MLCDEAIAIIEIQQLLYRYCRGIDRGEIATLNGVYHPGANDRHGAFDGPAEQLAARLVPQMDAAGVIGQHHITNMLIEVCGDRASGESYFLACHPSEIPGSDAVGLATAGGRYLDRFARRAGRWRIADRVVIMDFSHVPVSARPWATQASYPAGGRRDDDLSAAFWQEWRAGRG